MSGPNTISVEKLYRLIGTTSAPSLIDVRTEEDFAADPRFIPGSKKQSYEKFAQGFLTDAGSINVIICQRGAKLSHGVAALLRQAGRDAISLGGGIEAWRDAKLPLIPAAIIPTRQVMGNTRWVTRHRPKIDRIACPWLIRRFVDPLAEFLFVPPDQVEGVAARFDATAFDMPEGFWTHRGNTCSFDTMLTEFDLQTAPLLQMAKIIRAADTDNLADCREAAGLLAISLGLSRQFSDDLEQLQNAMVVYDALYRWCRDATDETHNWPVAAKAAE